MNISSILVIISLIFSPVACADYSDDFGDPRLGPVKTAIKKKQFAEAYSLLKKLNIETPRDANILGLMGFSLRKLEKRSESLSYYQQALNVDPKHLGSNEYLGELYLEMGQLAKAKERLDVIDSAFSCLFGCDEYDKLKAAIEEFEKKNK